MDERIMTRHQAGYLTIIPRGEIFCADDRRAGGRGAKGALRGEKPRFSLCAHLLLDGHTFS